MFGLLISLSLLWTLSDNSGYFLSLIVEGKKVPLYHTMEWSCYQFIQSSLILSLWPIDIYYCSPLVDFPFSYCALQLLSFHLVFFPLFCLTNSIFLMVLSIWKDTAAKPFYKGLKSLSPASAPSLWQLPWPASLDILQFCVAATVDTDPRSLFF